MYVYSYLYLLQNLPAIIVQKKYFWWILKFLELKQIWTKQKPRNSTSLGNNNNLLSNLKLLLLLFMFFFCQLVYLFVIEQVYLFICIVIVVVVVLIFVLNWVATCKITVLRGCCWFFLLIFTKLHIKKELHSFSLEQLERRY